MRASIGSLILMILFFVSEAYGGSFTIGAGGSYSQISLPDSVGSSSSIYSGPGYLLDLRMRFYPSFQPHALSFNFFGNIGQISAKNIGASDTHQQDYTVGGFDLYISDFFFGTQYGRAKSTLKLSSGSNVSFYYDLIGARAGFRIPFGNGFGMIFTGLYETGTAVPNGDNNIPRYQRVNQFSVLLTFYTTIIGDAYSD
jgi:hypothetical protein